jgi:hypothetical protein
MNNVDNNERQQRVLLQRGGSILNTTISMTTNMNDDDYNKRRQLILLQGGQSTIFKTIRRGPFSTILLIEMLHGSLRRSLDDVGMICELIRERNLHYTNNILQNEGVLVMMSNDDDIKQMRGMSVCLDFFANGRACIHG